MATKLETLKIAETEEEERRRRKKGEKRKKKVKPKPEVVERRKEKVPITEEREKKIILPPLPFGEMETAQEVSIVAFKKKLKKNRLLLPQISLNFIEPQEKINPIAYKRLLVKRRLAIPSIKFSEIIPNPLISIPSYLKKLKIRKIHLPNVKFSEINALIEIGTSTYHFEAKPPETIEKTEKITKVESLVSVEGVGGASVVEEKENILDLIFERKRWGSDVVNTREPHIIFLIERDYERVKEVVKSILQRIIEEMEEEFKGFKEETIGSSSEKRKEEREKEIERYLDILQQVFIVNVGEISNLERLELISLLDRINELKGRGTGFLVFCLRECRLDEIDNWCREKLANLTYQPNLHIWEVKRGVPLNIIGKLVGFGYETLKSILISGEGNRFVVSTYSKGETPDFLFEIGRKAQLEKRMKLKQLLSDIVRRNKGEEESELHYDLKCLIVYHLIRNVLFPEKAKIDDKFVIEKFPAIIEKIKTEHQFDNEVAADVYNKERGEVWEVETLFSQGRKGGIPTKKIDETIEKYLDEKGCIKINHVSKINVVIDNLTLYLHLSEIRKKIKIWKEKRLKEKVDFWIADWENQKLTPIKVKT